MQVWFKKLYTHLDNNGPSIPLSLSLSPFPPGSLRAKAMTRKASLVHGLTRLLARTAAQNGGHWGSFWWIRPSSLNGQFWMCLGLGCLAELSLRIRLFKWPWFLLEFPVLHLHLKQTIKPLQDTSAFPLERLLCFIDFNFWQPTWQPPHQPCLLPGTAATASLVLTTSGFTLLASSAVRCAATTAPLRPALSTTQHIAARTSCLPIPLSQIPKFPTAHP